MSISTQGGDQQRQPSVVSTGKKPAAGAKPATGAKAAKPGGPPRAGGGGKGPRKPVRPVKVSQGRAWGPIALFAAVGLLCAGIIGYGAWAAYNGSRSWQDRAADIPGIVNYFEKDPALVKQREHKKGTLEYKVAPPVAGVHNISWQNCMGNVYDAPIANENAVHSLEHGAVWVTYRDDLPADQVAALAAKVSGKEFTMMSPVKGLDKPVSLQAWGYQLKLDDPKDARIDEFIKVLRINATQEPGVGCSEGITATGTTPREVPQQQQAPQPPGS
jgi:hypothetical protein